ncbi:MAG: DUF554 domain-containing protein [Bacteroidaceae bacterium]|nr:DUF554 domain-containing protein [Bacteroidaceae bacterium]
MFAIFLNFLAVAIGSLIGAIAKRGIREKYLTVMNTAMGLCALVLGINVAMANMQRTAMPVLFICCMSLGGLIGTWLKLDYHIEQLTRGDGTTGNSLSQGITTAVLLCCVGTLSMMGPVLSALKGDDTYLLTAAVLNGVTMIVLASSYGIGVIVTSVIVFLWQGFFYALAVLSADFISDELVCETSIVGGILIAAAGLGILNIKDCKTANLLPALLMPLLYFFVKGLL